MNNSGKKETSLFLIIISIVIVVIVGVSIGWWISNLEKKTSTNPTTINKNLNQNTNTASDVYKDWQTYKNVDGGYSIKYPLDWEFSDSSAGNPAMFYDQRAQDQEIETELLQGSKIEIYWEETSATNLEEFEESIKFMEANFTTISQTPTTVANQPAIRKTGRGVTGDFDNVVYLISGGKFYSIIQYIPEDDLEEIYTPIFNQLLSTFTLLNKTANWQNYGFELGSGSVIGDYETKIFYKKVNGIKNNISTPFVLSEYHGSITPYGALFWKKGEIRTALEPNLGEYAYEYGIEPNFQLYSYTTDKFAMLPELTLKLEDQLFEKIYDIHFSSTEPKILIEIGEYDTVSSEFSPGLLDSQPVKSHGFVYDVTTNTFIEDNSLESYLTATGLATTLWQGMSWDSLNQIAVGAPGGEGCGAYDTLEVVNLDTEILQTIGGLKSYNFADDICNPSNGVSPDQKWFILSGKSNENTLDIYLFTTTSFPEPIKSKRGVKIDQSLLNSNSRAWFWDLKSWDTTNTYPVVTFSNDQVVDFNEE
ncbi:MAG: hypothetical protein ACD_12C00099G0002 [uncultured bacterium]|nr:MAG: hypothetical protein ACD_12C00099G0002 [uncultured bacterium]